MRIGGHGLRQHVGFLAPLFGLIAAVWLLRLVVYAAGAPAGALSVISVTLATAVAVLLAALLMHLRGFGSYTSVVASAFLLVTWAQLLIVAAIVFAALTGIHDVYSVPPYSGGETYGRHILGHLSFGIGTGTLFGSAMGCLLLWILRRLVPAVPTAPPLQHSAGSRVAGGGSGRR